MDPLSLHDDFKEFLRLLERHGVEYLLVGGYAVGLHGYVRTTADLDLWVKPTPENAGNVMRVLKDFGFDTSTALSKSLSSPRQVVRLGLAPLRIELITTASGVEFDSCYKNRVAVQIEDVKAQVISLEDLRTNKRASGRAKDVADLEGLL